MSAPIEIRRCRPLLGTFVEIAARGARPAALERAVRRAFAAIEALQARLSAHDPASELSRLNRKARARPVPVSADTWRVLRAAARLARQSAGAFDPTLAGRWQDIEFLPGRRVRFAPALRVDLGGIAKGYCVDRAVACLKRAGIESGLVNAGGDLRAFGPRPFPLHLRHPGDAAQLLGLGALRDAALATSASYAKGHERCAGRLRDGRDGRPLGAGFSVSVRASSALLADALAKVVAVDGARAEALLARYRAHAWVFGATSEREAPCAAAA
jgi:thiamine biosynthesis lipoprotein